ncbi:hypothetical protein EK21DRAFT_117927 [Setomelanomma holmii]|uniref:Uncharacterized protein n=1 Tax=Setomelanomma holmii TaxID=210430 RepID=A0A9P4GZA6_9PLEO|nr:hypothetical protein EK21DRAFT_117927 [Setomelanomma holmii]
MARPTRKPHPFGGGPFFTDLSHEVRNEVYKYLTFSPVITKDTFDSYALILTSRQAKREAEEQGALQVWSLVRNLRKDSNTWSRENTAAAEARAQKCDLHATCDPHKTSPI